MFPEALRDAVLTEALGDELVAYDRVRQEAHCLSKSAALVWRNCDGQTSIAQLADLLQKELALPDRDEDLVWLALEELQRARLLRQPVELPDGMGVSRRQMIRKLATVGAVSVLLPAVTSITAPTVAMAASSDHDDHGDDYDEDGDDDEWGDDDWGDDGDEDEDDERD